MLLSAVFLALFAPSVWAQSSVIDAYVASESPIAKASMLANIGPSGSKSSGAFSGIVIASPSTENPDYLYTWTRDSALTFQTIIDQFTLGFDTTLRGEIDNYVGAQAIVQQISNPSGDITTGGLGEPKFYVNETAFTGPWGRPQRDGPALRSTALITWANYLLSEGNTSYVTDTLWPIIENDLNYVSSNWNQSTYDLWEEIFSSSFFSTAVQHRALRQGTTLARAIGQTSFASSYGNQADFLLCFLQSYWNPTGYMTANTGGGRSGIDANSVLASIHTFDAAAGCDAITFQPCSDVALLNLFTYVNAFRNTYEINSGISTNEAVLTGRYPEDVYMGGNPWYLTTLAVAEQLYDSLIVWNSQGSLDVTNISLPFFKQFDSTITAGTYTSSSPEFSTLTAAVKTFSDGFVALVAKYTPSSGGLAEQISRSNGAPVSAVDLTWSYASALTAFDARAGVIPGSWGAQGLSLNCGGVPVAQTVSVTFNVDASTLEGQNVYLTGAVDALEDWSTDNAILLSSANYPTWSVTVNLPGSTEVQYKYIKKDGSGTVTWESDPNMEITTPANGTYATNDTWR
ncbi:glycoside hydrolase family 15 protein [Lentinula edodes]|uniref:Glucoamylase n=1 Tax=Lentinula edodes TaxID=5353 RepID=A0A1Q3EEG1_LENED|nr:glycoside hydrolase family 15 protein [Lentinula edodes]